MTSTVTDTTPGSAACARVRIAARARSIRMRVWIRKLHNYLGLYFLLFLWLFSISGLVINHPHWTAAGFWKAREETTFVRTVRRPVSNVDIGAASELMTQLGIVGEIADTKRSPVGERFEFQVVRPGVVFRVAARLDSAQAHITRTHLNAWGVADALHKFTGVKMDDPQRTRDWALTRIWSFAMDALSIGLLVLVASGSLLWWRLPQKRGAGMVALSLGLLCCAFFLYGFGARFTPR
jgi:Uncharacterized protein conserved in bacteria